jgi:hypothetical protein
MTNDPNPSGTTRALPPSAKTHAAVQKAVTALLDELAPERVLKRIEGLPGPVEQHRTPSGCVLQAASAALTVSWFRGADETLGELHVIVWKGVVARRGSRGRSQGATIIAEHVLLPLLSAPDQCLWSGTDGTRYDTPVLAAKCVALLQEQIDPREA